MIYNKRALQYFPLCPQELDATPFLTELLRTVQGTSVCKEREDERCLKECIKVYVASEFKSCT